MLSPIQRARGHLAVVRAQVLSSSPENVERCVPVLHEAIACVRAVEPKPELAGELSALHFELGVVSRLAQCGAEFYQGWGKALAATAAGCTGAGNTALSYSATGDPAPLSAPGSLSVKG